jgi:uncharacterized RmlC-like cupin family protein
MTTVPAQSFSAPARAWVMAAARFIPGVCGVLISSWGDQLEFIAEAGPGDFIYVPPYVPHQEINASDTEPLSCVLCRSGQEPVVVNLDIPVVEKPEEVHWVDNIHPDPKKKPV